MKAFEAWNLKNCKGCFAYLCVDDESKDACGMCVVQKQEVWRAALEWAMSHREMGHTVTERYVIPIEVIRTELEDR